jgi:two-component system response regulator
VEDNPDDEVLVARSFESLKPRPTILATHNLEEAGDFFFRRNRYSGRTAGTDPDLVLLDLHLDGQDGVRLIETIRPEEAYSTTPIVVFSNDFKEELIRRCYEAGANSCIQKPSEAAEFRDVVEAIGGYWLSPWLR